MAQPQSRREAADFEVAAASASHEGAEHFLQREKTPLQRVHSLFHRYEWAASATVLVLALLAFTVLVGSKFTDPFNLSLIMQQVMFVGTLALAETLVILTAGIDLSVGTMAVLTSVLMGKFAIGWGLPGWLALLLGLVVGTAFGALNGALITRLKLPPFIATLGTFTIFGALKTYFSGAQSIRSQDVEAQAAILQWAGKGFSIGSFRLTVGVMIMIVLYIAVWYALNWTAWGRHVYAVGNDRNASDLVGIRSRRVLFSIYAVAGLVCAIAAWTLIGRNGAIGPQAGVNAELEAITAAVIGGISLFGGRGNVFGALIGALIVGVFSNGLALYGLDPLWKDFAIGVLILLAVAVDQWIRRARA